MDFLWGWGGGVGGWGVVGGGGGGGGGVWGGGWGVVTHARMESEGKCVGKQNSSSGNGEVFSGGWTLPIVLVGGGNLL